MQLQTEIPDCVLRLWCPEDKPALIHHANNRKVWRNLADIFPHPYTEADADQWLSASMPSSSLNLAIAIHSQAVGGIGIHAGEGIQQYTGRLGYWLGESVWGQGIATAAARTMTHHAFTELPFARLEAFVFAWNQPSMRVLEKVGFVREGILRQSVFKDNQLIDSVLYALIRSDQC